MKKTKTRNKIDFKALTKRLFRIGFFTVLTVGILVLLLNFIVILSTEQKIYASDDIPMDENAPYDCIIVLGCGVNPNGEPSHMLYDRVSTAVALYHAGKADTLLMSGDHGSVGYDEVNTMKNLAMELGVPSEDIFMDHAGFSTYETMARAANIFGVKKAIVVTQEYHLTRALFLANAFDIEAAGYAADPRTYAGQGLRDIREAAARCKDLLSAIVKPNYMGGDPIDIHGDGNITNG